MNAPLRLFADTDDSRLFGIGLTAAERALAESLPAVLHGPTYSALFDLGIRGVAITGVDAFDALHVESVVFLGLGRFEFARDLRDQFDSRIAVIIPIREDGRTVDLCAWNMDTGGLATWRGAPLLLEGEIAMPRFEVDDVCVYPDPREWLRADRRGVVILDAKVARWRLAEGRLIVSNADFGRRLRQMLRLPEPRVFVESTGRAAA